MHDRRPFHRQALIGLVAISLFAAACGSSSAPTTTASASPAAAATASAAASIAATSAESASPAAAGSPAADPAASLSIAAPYTLAPLEATQAAQFEASLKAGLGAMAFPGVPVSNTSSFLDSVVGGAAGASGKVTSTTIQGKDVKLIEGSQTHVAAYLHGSTIVFAYGQTADETLAIITAVIQASE